MPKITYQPRNFSQESQRIIAQAIRICERFERMGYNLTLRQLYYQFVAADLIPNTMQSYKRLGSIINDARLAGLIDWDHITDRTRNVELPSEWDSPQHILRIVAQQYSPRMWADQPEYVEAWVEKEALADVVGQACIPWHVPYFSCRGYTSQSELWGAAMRLKRQERQGKKCTVIHLGDHDPSGIDMTRDIEDRLALFGCRATVHRIALNMDQVELYQPPPNPAKMTDSRFEGYSLEFGDESWELDALPPDTLDTMISGEIQAHLDLELWDEMVAERDEARTQLAALSRHWPEVAGHVRDQGWMDEEREA